VGPQEAAELGYLVLIAIFAAIFWLVVVVPQRRSRRRRESELASIRPGDEVVTAGGIIGTVRAEDGDELRVEIAPDVEVRLARKAVAGVLRPPAAEGEAVEPQHPVGS
jgi:preprotein translocase subunit YajC